ncbi:DUF6207 family protein [Streptomyces sp. NPDC056160]|uniref:DUF6207 family protein n=1 Tax=Streptomyces sp. NPDC056160 TaxID=3345731 RepID=UPI0035D9B3C5
MAAADDQTGFAFQSAVASLWATTMVERTSRDAGQPSVRLPWRPRTDAPSLRGCGR